MSEGIPAWFIEKFDDTVKMLAQQRDRRLAGMTSGGGMFVGNSIFFPRMGAVEMYDSPRFASLALANGQMDMVEVTAAPKFVALGIWDPDIKKLNVNVAAQYGRAAAMAGNRAEDNMIVAALNSAVANGVTGVGLNGATTTTYPTTIGSYAAVADLDTIAAGVAQLGSQEMFEGEDICMVVPFKLKTNMALDPYMALNNVRGNVPWNDLNWRTFQRLNDENGAPITQASDAGTTGVDMFMFCRSAVSADYNNEMTTIDERIGASLTTMIGNWFQAGAAVTEATGVIRIKSQYNFTLMRKAIPIADQGPD
ncbi:MAG TPA: phage capsid protein [Caulobacteraceae bacterium]|nr:phage capsid protein [Caulobacteraceae bacterium]